MTEAIGFAAAMWPRAWLGLFGHDPGMLATGAAYLHAAGPFYGFFGLGLALYFASQGAGKLRWPLFAGFARMLVALGGGWLALRATGSLQWLFLALGLGMLLYGVLVTVAVTSGSLAGARRTARARQPRRTEVRRESFVVDHALLRDRDTDSRARGNRRVAAASRTRSPARSAAATRARAAPPQEHAARRVAQPDGRGPPGSDPPQIVR